MPLDKILNFALLRFLQGYKTYIISAFIAIHGIVGYLIGEVSVFELITFLSAGGLGGSGRAGIAKLQAQLKDK